VSDSLAPAPGVVLVVEDSDVVRAIITRYLTEAGHVVLVAEDGEQALALCRAERPEIVLLNQEMPVLDGRQTLLRMKAEPGLEEIPVIFVTGRSSRDDMIAGLRMGAHDYLCKPFDPPELIARVSAALRVARLQQQLVRRNEELDALSRTDALTGLHNRRHAEEVLAAECARAQRYHRPIGVFMIDVDHFKAINDRFGHAGGDEVLRAIARRLLVAVRQQDIAARWGGEEFLVVLPETGSAGAAAAAERVLAAMRHDPVPLEGERSCQFTVSIGVADGGETDPEALVKGADQALYAAKAAGRDRMAVAPPPAMAPA
jgi:two-component system cell cycle response regulator